ncbi:MAG: GNAT family N-acetyltransferase [Chloroflexota bacterium]
MIQLKPIAVGNWQAVIALKLAPDQQDFVPSNLYSIAEAQFYPDAQSRAIYNLIEEIVGYALYGRDVSTGKWKVFRIMIDAHYQGQGYGKAAMAAIIQEISAKPRGNQILIRYQKENTVAKRLYTELGFVPISTHEDSTVTAQLTLQYSPSDYRPPTY